MGSKTSTLWVCSQLEEIRILRSNIPAIGRHSFWGVPTLKVLDLRLNNISQVVQENFRGLANLRELYLDDNKISDMPSAPFNYLTELRVLSIARNQIYELAPRVFLKLGKLRELDLSGNNLIEMNPEVFKDIQVSLLYTATNLQDPQRVLIRTLSIWAEFGFKWLNGIYCGSRFGYLYKVKKGCDRPFLVPSSVHKSGAVAEQGTSHSANFS